jgi:hypothetical protein
MTAKFINDQISIINSCKAHLLSYIQSILDSTLNFQLHSLKETQHPDFCQDKHAISRDL